MKREDYSKPDFWSRKAREEGYPARSVYKLEEIAGKFNLFANIRGVLHVLDLGAAPGSWSLYLWRTLGKKIALTACDLSPLSAQVLAECSSAEVDKDAGGFAFIEGDFTAEPAKSAILERGPFDIVLCDAAPATTGVRLVDTARSEELAASALLFAETALRTGGSIVIKLFQGDMTAAFPRKAGPLFKKTCLFKPRACRSESFETYFIGLKRRITDTMFGAGCGG